MKNITLFFVTLFCFPILAFGQPMETVYSVKEFRQVADSMQLSVAELCDYPVISPVKHPVISSGFGIRKHPVYMVRKFHAGIDFVKAKGTPVYATGNGTVIRKGYDSGYGNFIEIQHAGGFRSFYAHLSKTLVSAGDSVRMGKYIACVGNSGLTTGCHLHYEIRKGNRFLNPMGWCCCLLEIILKVKTV
jgi:murein DD-endopeptidase MepM/ murein hydrolase activator NlpD